MTLERLVLKKLDRAYYRWCGNKIQTASRVDSRTGDGVSRERVNSQTEMTRRWILKRETAGS